MTLRPFVLAGALAALLLPSLPAQQAAPDLLHDEWPARWITCPGAAPRGPGVYHFRKRFVLAKAPAHFVVYVSADNRFTLFANGVRIGDGPYRGDLDHWRYEAFDLGPRLHAGENTLAATVWNCGALSPTAQMSDQTAFVVQGETPGESVVNTDGSWEAEVERGESFQPISTSDINNYYAAAPGEQLDAARYDWNWQTSPMPWAGAVMVGTGEPGRYPGPTPRGAGSGINRWFLVRDPLPQMAYDDVPTGRMVRVTGAPAVGSFPATIAARTKATYLLDRGAMTTAYPEIDFGRGRGATIRLRYAEALVDDKGQKGDRNETRGRHLVGLHDTVLADGGAGRSWSPHWWRAWRFLQVEVETADEALDITALKAHYTGFPFMERGSFEASDPQLARIWEVGTRTARMNAHETYMDCAYWEQLQYIGDTRIQALISYVSFGDDRLARQALDAYDDSRISDGLSQSRYPASLNQVIPTFSLYWIGMLHDYWMYRPDGGNLARWVPDTRGVLEWYGRHVRTDGLLGRMPWWNFGDWTRDFVFGVPPQEPDGGSALLTLTYMAALRNAADLEAYLGDEAMAADYRKRAEAAGRAVYAACWDEAHGLIADTPAHAHFSEEANAVAVILDVVPKKDQEAVMDAVLSHTPRVPVPSPGEFSPASVYFRFYVARAMDHAGMADRYLANLGPWRAMLDLGLSTFAETAEPTRSDDHAWSAHPDYDLLTLVAGIRPASPAFRTVRVAPHPGGLRHFTARMPHPAGEIVVRGEKRDADWEFDVTLPPGTSGTFVWEGRTADLAPGENRPLRR